MIGPVDETVTNRTVLALDNLRGRSKMVVMEYGPNHPKRFESTEDTCHCGAAYNGCDHCPECGCEFYESGCDHEVER